MNATQSFKPQNARQRRMLPTRLELVEAAAATMKVVAVEMEMDAAAVVVVAVDEAVAMVDGEVTLVQALVLSPKQNGTRCRGKTSNASYVNEKQHVVLKPTLLNSLQMIQSVDLRVRFKSKLRKRMLNNKHLRKLKPKPIKLPLVCFAL